MKSKSLLFVLLLAVVICQSTSDIVSVDGRKITQQDVSYRLAIDKAYGNDQSGTTEVVLQLIMQELREVIADKEQIFITDSMIEQEALRIDMETKAPGILAKVKAVFTDHHEYLKHYVRPVLVEKSLQEEFFFDTLHQKEPLRIINEAFTRSAGKPSNPDSTLNVFEPDNEQLKYYENSAEKGIGEDKYSYFFLIEKNGKKTVYLVPKMDYTEWLHTEALKVRVHVYDEELRKKLLTRTRNSEFWQKILSKERT